MREHVDAVVLGNVGKCEDVVPVLVGEDDCGWCEIVAGVDDSFRLVAGIDDDRVSPGRRDEDSG